MLSSLNRTAAALLTGCAMSVAPLAFATIVTPAASWASCDPGIEIDCQPDSVVAAPMAPPPDAPPPAAPAPAAPPPFPGLSPSDVSVKVPPGVTVTPGRVRPKIPQLCGPTIQTPIPFVGFRPCI
jgi:hypothetical protein